MIFWGTEWFDASVLDFLPSPLLHIRRYVSQSDWIGMLLDSGQGEAAKEAPVERFLRLPAQVRPV